MALDPEFAAPPTASEEVRKNTVKLYIVVKRISTHRWTVVESFAERRLAENFIADPRHDALDGHCCEVSKPKKYIIQRKTGNKWKDTGWTSLPDGWDTKHPKPVLLAKAKSCVKKAQEMWPKETYRITEMVRP